MKIFGNILWFVLGGAVIFLCYGIGCLFLCLTLIGIPFGLQCFKISLFALSPFGKKVVNVEKSTGIINIIMNILWILLFGLEIALMHLILALLFAITVIGIPFARQHMKLCALALSPFGKKIEKAA